MRIPVLRLTRLPGTGKTAMMISKHENLLINSKLIRVSPDQKYMLKANVICKQGIPNAAYLCVMMLDQDGKEIDRKIRWINDFSGKPTDYSIIFKTFYGATHATLGFRINAENQINNLEPTRGAFETILPPVSLLRLENIDKDTEEQYDQFAAPPFDSLTGEEENALERKIVWVFGSPRSGSTWLTAGLLNHEQNIMWDEPFVGYHIMHLYGLHENRSDFFYSTTHRYSWQQLLRKMILSRAYSQARTLAKNVIVKEPNSSSGADFVMSCLPNSKLLFLLRDGRDVVDSQIDAHGPNSWNRDLSLIPLTDAAHRLESIKEHSETWRFFTEVVLKTYNEHSPSLRLLVKYEDLRKDTVNQLQRIYDFLAVGISKETLEVIVEKNRFENIPDDQKGSGKFHRSATPGKWKENFSDEEKHIMEQIMGNTLQKLGYTS